jgi:CheY-like chemotaxis protein
LARTFDSDTDYAEHEPRLRALVVDDHESNRKLMQVFLPALGCDVSSAASGEEALDLARIAPFDLVIIDLHMPGIDGDEATRQLRARGRSRFAFVAQWSTDPMGRLDLGLYDARLAKPLLSAELDALVDEARRRLLGRSDSPRRARFLHRRAP